MADVKISALDATVAPSAAAEFAANQAGTSKKYTAAQICAAGLPYLESTWTPAVKFGGNSVAMTYNSQVGTYTRIGNRVFFSGYINLSAKGSSTGAATISLPLTSLAGLAAETVANVRFQVITFSGQFVATIDAATSVIALGQVSTAGSLTSITHANFANTSELIISGQYPV